MAKPDGGSLPLAAVIGHPVAHSLSPEIFRFLAEAAGRPLVYKRIDLNPSELSTFFPTAARQDLFVGWNVTLPHKEAMYRLVRRLSPEARAVGAVNVVHFEKRGPRGLNTDVIGIRETLREQKLSLRGECVVLYGAGGAAKAVAQALKIEGAGRIWVLNRSRDRASALCRCFGPRFKTAGSAREIRDPVRLVVNSTPVGMKGVRGRFVFPAGASKDTLAFDLIYSPARTRFLLQAEERGMRGVNGLDMLLWQAVATWEIWFGAVSDRRTLKRKLKEHLCRCVI
jgi:shikimate dehydrogenase